MEELREKTDSIYVLVQKRVLSPHQLFIWIKGLKDEARKERGSEWKDKLEDLKLTLLNRKLNCVCKNRCENNAFDKGLDLAFEKLSDFLNEQ